MFIPSPFPDPRGTPPLFPFVPLFAEVWPFICPWHCTGQTSPKPRMATHGWCTLKSRRLPAWTTGFSLWQGLRNCPEFLCGSCSGDSRRPLPPAPRLCMGCATGVRPEGVGEGVQYTLERFSVLFVWHMPAASGHVVCVAFSSWFLACFVFFFSAY